MANYVTDPNDSKKQIPGKLPTNAFDRTSIPTSCTMSKTPHYVYITETPTDDVGFFFGGSASFATKATAEGGDDGDGIKHLTGSQHYVNYGKPTVGTRLDIHPNAWSGSKAKNVVSFVYKSGLSTGGR